MNPLRGEVRLAKLDPVQGSGQAGTRPVLILQNDRVSRFARTVLAIPFTTNLSRSYLPTALQVDQGDGGLLAASVLLCHQLRVLDKSRLRSRLGTLHPQTLKEAEFCVLLTLGIR